MSNILNPNAFKIFLVGCTFFLLAFALLAFGEHRAVATQALIGTAIVMLTTGAAYGLLSLSVRKSALFVRTEAFGRAEVILWALLLAFACLGAVAFLLYAQTTAALELIRHMLDANYVSPFGELERRLATTSMPIWAQVAFEAARRFAMPFCLLHYFSEGNPIPRRPWLTAALVILALFFAFWTLDRVIPVMYAAMLYSAHYFRTRRNPLVDRWFYITIVVIVLVVTGMKNIQYGEFRTMDLTPNSTITEFLGDNQEADPSVEQPSTAVNSPLDYSRFMVLSVVERIVLSPVAMALYAFDEYDESNFRHWSSTRIFSLFGFGHFVSSLEEGEGTKYHDAFPVTFLGDLWRNGGQLYMPVFGIFAGILLFLMDRVFFVYAPLPTWQTLGVFGIAFWFYGNAVNATMALLVFGGFGTFAFALVLASMLERDGGVQTSADGR